MSDFFSVYLDYTADTEAHKIYHRWSVITSIGALLGRSNYIPFGHSRIFPNFFTMLIGDPGARKSSAIKLVNKLISDAGYEHFAATRSSREKFLLDLADVPEEEQIAGSNYGKKNTKEIDLTTENLWGSTVENKDEKEVYIVADEFNEFISSGNIDFYTTLGNLWDWDNENKNYADRVKNSKSVSIYQPMVSILGGNTQENFARAFPPEILGHGFLARLILIHGEHSGRLIAWPEAPDKELSMLIKETFSTILRLGRKKETKITPSAKELLATIYKEWPGMSDTRFRGYATRRYTHLLKLCIITMVACFKEEVDEIVVIYANTMLSAAEAGMPKALGEFGKSKTSDVANKILVTLNSANAPMEAKQLWRLFMKDLDNLSALGNILNGLATAEKVQYIKGAGWLPKKEVIKTNKFVDWSLLSEEERNLL